MSNVKAQSSKEIQMTKHGDIDPVQFVIPGLTRNPVFSRVPAFAGMMCSVVTGDVVHV